MMKKTCSEIEKSREKITKQNQFLKISTKLINSQGRLKTKKRKNTHRLPIMGLERGLSIHQEDVIILQTFKREYYASSGGPQIRPGWEKYGWPFLFQTTGSWVKIRKGFPTQCRGLRELFRLNKNPKQQSKVEVGLQNYLIRVFFISKIDQAKTIVKEEETGHNRSQHIAFGFHFLPLTLFPPPFLASPSE